MVTLLSAFCLCDNWSAIPDTEYGIEEIDQWLPRLHCVVLGPGLGRNQSMLGRISIIIEKAKSRKIPIVVDADGLWHLATNPSLLQGQTGPPSHCLCLY